MVKETVPIIALGRIALKVKRSSSTRCAIRSIIAKIKGKTVAFEVETGSGEVRGDDRVKEKFARVRKNYANFFIVVSDWKLKNKYKKHGKVVTRMGIKAMIEQLGRK